VVPQVLWPVVLLAGRGLLARSLVVVLRSMARLAVVTAVRGIQVLAGRLAVAAVVVLQY
jgi:hypothetical protein